MPLDAAFHELYAQLHTVREALTGLRTTAVEDKPLRGDVVLVDTFGDAADDLLGWLEEALLAAREAEEAVARPTDLDQARRALTVCQERFNRIAHRFSTDLFLYERIAELVRLGRARGGEWQAWAKSVKAALDWCRQPLFDADQALFLCWQEIVDRVGVPAFSVQTTGITPARAARPVTDVGTAEHTNDAVEAPARGRRSPDAAGSGGRYV